MTVSFSIHLHCSVFHTTLEMTRSLLSFGMDQWLLETRGCVSHSPVRGGTALHSVHHIVTSTWRQLGYEYIDMVQEIREFCNEWKKVNLLQVGLGELLTVIK